MDFQQISESISKFFKTSEGKPDLGKIGFIAAVIVFSIIFFSKGNDSKESATENQVSVNYNLPEDEKRRNINIGKNADLGYVTAGELKYILSEQLNDFARTQNENLAIELQKSSSETLSMIREEQALEQEYIKKELEKKIAQLENEIDDLHFRTSGGSALDVTISDPSTPSTPTNYASSAYGDQILTGIPINQYSASLRESASPIDSTSTPLIDYGSNLFINNFTAPNNAFIVNSGDPYNSGYSITNGINAGQLFNGVLVTGAVSSKDKHLVVVHLKEDIMYNGKTIIPEGSKLLGYAVADFNTRQIYFDINRLVLNDREVQIKASLVNRDGTPGFCSKYIDKTKEKFWQTFALDFAAAMLQSYKDISYYIGENGIPVKSYDDTSLNSAIDAGSSGLIRFSDKIMADAQAMGGIILVDPHIDVKIMLEENINLEKLTAYK